MTINDYAKLAFETMVLRTGAVVAEHRWEDQTESCREDWREVVKAVFAKQREFGLLPLENRMKGEGQA